MSCKIKMNEQLHNHAFANLVTLILIEGSIDFVTFNCLQQRDLRFIYQFTPNSMLIYGYQYANSQASLENNLLTHYPVL